MADHLERLAVSRGAVTVAVYVACRGEADPESFVGRWIARGGTVVWPRVTEDGGLAFFAARDGSGFVPGYAGIPEPTDSCPPVAIEAIDLLVVPGIAYDALGNRLGQGGGAYDRLLSRPGRPYAVGLAYALQVVALVPVVDHDRPVDTVLTERGPVAP